MKVARTLQCAVVFFAFLYFGSMMVAIVNDFSGADDSFVKKYPYLYWRFLVAGVLDSIWHILFALGVASILINLAELRDGGKSL